MSSAVLLGAQDDGRTGDLRVQLAGPGRGGHLEIRVARGILGRVRAHPEVQSRLTARAGHVAQVGEIPLLVHQAEVHPWLAEVDGRVG